MATPSISKPEWVKSWSDNKCSKSRACWISGLHVDNEYQADKAGRVWVDASIARLIVLLNQAGFTTMYCCSGLPEDHSRMKDVLAGYISFTETKRRLPFRLPRGLRWDGDCIRSRIGGSTDVLRAAWMRLEELIRTVYR